MKKLFFLAAVATMTLASCMNDEFVVADTQPADIDNGMTPILFNSLGRGMTRADFVGADAASKLGNKFVVTGFKGETTASPGSIVFDNYVVEYLENTANTTESNTNNWEYVGKGVIKHATDNGITQQTIKYWDFSKTQYDFIAWSTGKKTAIYEGTPSDGEVLVSEITPATAQTIAYTFEGKAADLKECYISDLVTVKKGSAGTYGEVSGYGQPVTLAFRQLGTKVRIALYETIPGYSVKNVQFYSAAASNDASAAAAKIFTTETNEIYTKGTYTVYFPTVDTPSDADNNQAHITFAGDGDQLTIVDWSGLNYTIRESGESSADAIYLGRTSNTASFAGNANENYYKVFLPNQNGTNLNLRVNYTLESIDGSKELIEVKGATAQVPLIYTQWKPGFAYTYLFKISDKTNGYTGAYDPTKPDNTTVNSDPAGLYPITFDAVVVNAEDKDQETITTVSAPSITTYQKGSEVVNNNEYLAATGPIFVTVNDGNEEETPDLAHGKLVTLKKKTTSSDPEVDDLAALYTLPADHYTEADVVAAMQTRDDDAADGTIKGRSGLVLTEADFTLVTSIQYGVDGNAINLTGLKNPAGVSGTYNANAMRFEATAGTYAFVYTKKASTGETAKFQAVSKIYEDDPNTTEVETPESVNGLYRYKLVAATADQDVKKDVMYFANSAASTPAITAFLGQGVSNLYTRSGSAGSYVYTPASGYAKTGVTYYYTTDGGLTYKDAENIAYADFASTTLYTDANATIKKTETEPQDGQAYYTAGKKYCVICPQRTNGLYVFQGTDTAVEGNFVACGSSDKAVKGMTYFDKYSKNNGVYYTKVIKVQ